MIVCGGYFLTRAVERPDYTGAGLLPPQVLSLSQCICHFVPDDWAIEWVGLEDRAGAARAAGIGEADLPAVVRWTTERIDSETLGWPRVFLGLEDALSFAARFLPPDAGFRLLGIGLHQGALDAFLAGEGPPPGVGVSGIYRSVRDGNMLAPGGTELGWEVLCYGYGGFCSWLCNGLEVAVAQELGIVPNEAGFLSSATEAQSAAEYCGRDDVGAEPGFWAPWLVVEYDPFREAQGAEHSSTAQP